MYMISTLKMFHPKVQLTEQVKSELYFKKFNAGGELSVEKMFQQSSAPLTRGLVTPVRSCSQCQHQAFPCPHQLNKGHSSLSQTCYC